MPFIKVDGKLYPYGYYEDVVKPLWKEKMRKNDLKNKCKKQYLVLHKSNGL